jgi:hypothetical protein
MKNSSPIYLFIITLIFVLQSCEFPKENKQIVDRFYLTSIDSLEQIKLSYQNTENSYIEVIGGAVYRADFSDEYILTYQHPKNADGSLDNKTTNYYIIDLNKTRYEINLLKKQDSLTNKSTKYYPEKPIPLTLLAFNEEKKRLNIPDTLAKSIVFEELFK